MGYIEQFTLLSTMDTGVPTVDNHVSVTTTSLVKGVTSGPSQMTLSDLLTLQIMVIIQGVKFVSSGRE